MKNAVTRYRMIGFAVAVGIMIGPGQLAWAGWTGSMNGAGFGKASANVTSSTSKSNAANSAVMTTPSAAIKPTAGFSGSAPLPSGASASTFSRIKGLAGYVWQATTAASNGDKTDNSQLTYYVTPTSRLATTTLDVLSVTTETNGCGDGQALYTFIWHWTGSDAGTAQQVKFYEFDGELPTNTDFNADVGSLSNAVLLAGPVIGAVFTDCDGPCPTNFDEEITHGFCGPADSNKVYMVTDGIAVSLPCPLSFSGFLPPIGGADATGGSCSSAVRGFKLGSTIPVKMNLLNCDGLPVSTGDHMIQVSKCDNSTGGETPIDASPTDAATTGNLFRLTAPGQWQFNLSTKGVSKGTWKIIVTLSDGSVHSVYVDLK